MSFALRALLFFMLSGALVLSFAIGRMTASSSGEQISTTRGESDRLVCQRSQSSRSVHKPIVVSRQNEIDGILMERLTDEIREVVREELEDERAAGQNPDGSTSEPTEEDQDKIDISYDQAELVFRKALDQKRWSKADENLFHSYLAQLPRDHQDDLLSQLHVAVNNQELELALAE